MKKNPPEWLRWLYLALAFFGPFAAWMDFRNYPHYYELGLFSEERWAEVMAGFRFRWAIQGLVAAGFLYQFILFTWRKHGGREIVLADQTFSTAVLLIWAALLPLRLVPGSVQALWGIMLIVFVVVVGRSWVTYFENKRLEEQNHE